MKFYSLVAFLERTPVQYKSDMLNSHRNKLRPLYKDEVLLSERKNFVKNHHQYCVTESETEVLKKGLNFAKKKKTDPLFNKTELERLKENLN